MDKPFSQNFVQYHGCGCFYQDGTLPILNINEKCIKPTTNPFGKKQMMLLTKLKQDHYLRKITFLKKATLKDISNI